MFDIVNDGNGTIVLRGRFDASQTDRVREVLEHLTDNSVLDFEGLDYISSAGLGVLLGTQKRLAGSRKGLKLICLNNHIREIFRIAGFDQVFEIE